MKMRRIYCVVALLLASVGVFVGGAGTAGAAKSAPSFAAQLVHDGSCSFTLTGTWKNTAVDHVYASWYVDNPSLTTSFLTTEAPSFFGTLNTRRRVATMPAGPFVPATDSHTWQVRVQFYNGGAQLAQVFTSVVSANCTIPPQTP